MKRQTAFIWGLGLTVILCSCSKIPDKPVSDKLSTDELSKAMKSDTSFANFYDYLRKNVDEFDDIKKAKYSDVTYRRLFKYSKFLQDTVYWEPLNEKWRMEWKGVFGAYPLKADSTISFWKDYLAEHSLDRYVKIELAKIDKEYYEYIGEIKEVNLGFRLTPLQGTIEQIRFSYAYKAKINEAHPFKKRNCISTSPFSSSTIRYWEVDYSDKEDFSGKNVETFLRDYNLQIDIASIRKDGVNISIDDFGVPEQVSDYFAFGANDTMMSNFYKEQIIKTLINKEYLPEWDFINKKADEVREKKDKQCFDFLKELFK